MHNLPYYVAVLVAIATARKETISSARDLLWHALGLHVQSHDFARPTGLRACIARRAKTCLMLFTGEPNAERAGCLFGDKVHAQRPRAVRS